MCAKLEFSLFYTANLQMFLASNFFVFQLFPRILNRQKILHIFDTNMQKKK
jgi:hypothetical protein